MPTDSASGSLSRSATRARPMRDVTRRWQTRYVSAAPASTRYQYAVLVRSVHGPSVGADAEERRVAERELTRVAEQEIEAERQDREDPGHDEHVQVVRIGDPERCCDRRHGAQRHGRARDQPMRSARAKRPAGRKSRTRMMATKPTASR